MPELHPLDTPAYKRRSIKANSYYWGVVVAVLSWNIYLDGKRITPQMWHRILKRYLETETTRVNTPTMADYILAIQEMAARVFNLYIPDPDEIDEDWMPWLDHRIIK